MLKASLYHIQINISNPSVSIPFYKDLMLFIGYEIKMEGDDYIGFTDAVTDFWFIGTESKYIINGFHRKNSGLNHLAFKMNSKQDVDVFYNTYLISKGIKTLYDTPKLFPEYGDGYYAVFFEDPDRLKLEVVYKASEADSNKNYHKWHVKKEIIDSKEIIPDFNQQDIWWCSLGLNVGFEEDGKNDDFERPVLILKKFSKDVFIGLPLTSTIKNSPYYFPYSFDDVDGSIILSHPRLLSVKRLNRRLAKISRGLFSEINKRYLKLFT